MALPTLDAVFASAADQPRRYMLSQWLVGEKEETQGASSVLVSGAGSEEANGTYTETGEANGKKYYNKEGSLDDISAISWNGIDSWIIWSDGASEIYQSLDDVEFPWQVTTWNEADGGPPLPTITEIPAANPIANYITLPERYLWAKIAVAAGAPKDEAAYIGLPKQYAWKDIYNAVSGDIAQSTVVVSGLSDTQHNGRYVYDGEENGKPKYKNGTFNILWNGGSWTLGIVSVANSESDVAYPWLATDWFDEGVDPTGLVLTPETPNHTDWTEKQALGHIAAAYRGDTGTPENLATYINWPWRYQVASIITAL
jgi:hypothetical protein